MELDVRILDLLPAEEVRLARCGPRSCLDTCLKSCGGTCRITN